MLLSLAFYDLNLLPACKEKKLLRSLLVQPSSPKSSALLNQPWNSSTGSANVITLVAS